MAAEPLLTQHLYGPLQGQDEQLRFPQKQFLTPETINFKEIFVFGQGK